MNSNIIFIVVLSLSVLLLLLPILNLNSVKNEIRDDLRKRGAIDIHVLYNGLGSSWGSKIFDVLYTDAQGSRKTAQCELKSLGTFQYGEIVWYEALSVEPDQIALKPSSPQSDEQTEKTRVNDS
jgi:hypothetical protein